MTLRLLPALVLLLVVTLTCNTQTGATQAADEGPPTQAAMKPDADPPADAAIPRDEGCGNVSVSHLDLPAQTPGGGYDAGLAGFSVQVGDEVIPYTLMSFLADPGETVELEAVFGRETSRFEACAQGGTVERVDADAWTWTAPEEPGHTQIHVLDSVHGGSVTLLAFVLQPYYGADEVAGYRIGKYEREPLRNLPAYEMPDGLIRVEPGMGDLWLSPHFQLRQFLCKQPDGPQKFAIIHTRMLLKLELLLQRVNGRGVEARTFAVLSGFRTPWYNSAIGNHTKYTRHAYGDAADIYIDEDGDGHMDDLNGDGRITYADARWMAQVMEEAVGETPYQPFVGGLGIYGPAPHRSAFVHVDTRGYKARWEKP